MTELKKHSYKILRLTETAPKNCEESPTTKQVFLNQVLDSAIVGGISGISAFVAAGENAAFKVLALAFCLTFLVKMKEYRKIE